MTYSEKRAEPETYIERLKRTDLDLQYHSVLWRGMKRAEPVMLYNEIEWTSFTAE